MIVPSYRKELIVLIPEMPVGGSSAGEVVTILRMERDSIC
jgi:hypothetical protein